jgi:hypothetical protein
MTRKAIFIYRTATASQFGDKEKQMSYTVTSDLEVCGKSKGDTLTEKELLEAGVNIEALVQGLHIKSDSTPSIKPVTTQEGAK